MTDQTTTAEAEEPSSFASFLLATNKGRTESELSRQLQRLVAAVNETGKPGKLTLTIEIKPQANTDGVVTVTDRVTVKAPELARPASIFFITDAAGLSRTDPRQLTFDNITQEQQTR